jgi:peptide deformylase
MITLPDYVVADVNNLEAIADSTIRKKSAPLSFPLSQEDIRDIDLLISKFQTEKDILGLAAPQIGILKRVIVFQVPNIFEEQEPFPFSVWINPIYEKAGEEKDFDFEQCFSVKDFTGPVPRWTRVHYKAYDVEGHIVEGTAEGVTARVIQHETDHLDGILFIDLVPRDQLMTIEEFNQFANEFKKLKLQ